MELKDLAVNEKLEDVRGGAAQGIQQIVNGEHDDLPEAAFYMVGTIDEVLEKAQALAKEAA